MTLLPLCSIALVGLVIQSAGAQHGDVPATVFGDARVPLHAAPGDLAGVRDGLWAGGANYKASFHDGFAFYPFRGPDQPLVRLRWRTQSITWGGVELFGEQRTTHTTDWRHELRYGPVTEAYDILPEGVEQSFVLHRPLCAGDLVITGTIDGGLRAPVAADGQQPLAFAAGSRDAVRYGEANAFDSAGRRTAVTTAYDGRHIRLTLAAEFLQAAAFPVTIDPLTSAVRIGTSLNMTPVIRTALAADNATPGGRLMVAYTRRFAAGDDDAYGLLCDKDFANPVVVFTDVTTRFDTTQVDVAHVDGADRFVVVMQRDFSVSVYIHHQSSTTLNSGTLLSVSGRSGKPSVAGARGTGTSAFMVFDAYPQVQGKTEAKGILIDAQTGSLSAAVALDLSSVPAYTIDENPVIVPTTRDQADWIAIWRQRNTFTRTQAIYSARITAAGTVSQNDLLLLTLDKLPGLAVAGSPPPGGRYVAAWIRDTASGDLLEAQRFDQPASGPPTVVGPVRILSSTGSASFGDLGLAHDWQTRSHWGLTYSRSSLISGRSANIVRLGNTAGVTERGTLAGHSLSPNGPAVAYAEPSGQQRFLATYGEVQGSFPKVVGRELRYSPGALTSSYGAACYAAASISSNPPFAGHEFFAVDASPVAWREPVVFVIGLAPTSLSLANAGFVSGCSLVVDPSTAALVGFLNPDKSGQARITLVLPDAPLFLGDLFVQAAVVPINGALPFTTQGLSVRVR